MNPSKTKLFYGLLLAVTVIAACNNGSNPGYDGWRMAGGNPDMNHYSTLTQIDTGNVNNLEVVWTYHTGDADTVAKSQIQCNSIIVNGVLYGTTPAMSLFALDAATGKQKWVYKPVVKKDNKGTRFNLNNNRGVTYWTDGKDDERILYVTGPYLQAVDAKTGNLIDSFGDHGKVEMHVGLGENAADLFVTATTPGTIYKDLFLTGTRVSESMDAAPGYIRAFDVRTGAMKWVFHTIPQPGEPGYETWENKDAYKLTGGANNWMGITIDQKRGIAYVPIGSASMDFYGGRRRGADLYANCLLALDAATGKLLWHFQYVHHDTWDRDPSSAPVLITVKHDGKMVDAVVQTTKQGFVFVFDRETGKSLFPIKEVPVDTVTALKGEKLWPTQPEPQLPKPFVRQSFTEKDINPYLPDSSREDIRKQLATFHTGQLFTPQSKEGTIIFPGFDGGAEWGGPSVDPNSGVIYINASEMSWILKMYDVKEAATGKENYLQAGVRLFQQNCMSCHGKDRKGGGNYPSLIGVDKKLNENAFINFINNGRRMMPAFHHLPLQEKEAIASYVLNLDKEQKKPFVQHLSAKEAFRSVPYSPSGYNKFLTKDGLPAIAPPWGTLTAIDLNTGQFLWKDTLGQDARFKNVKNTGTENYGGSAITKSGLLFIAATSDGMFRAFNKRNGKLLWQVKLPNAGFATPSIYEANGKEYVVIACGGGKLGTKSGDSYVAFALKK
ncbi:PQQ-binding-like beta-propeller repeat protein [Mucilaginibacter sp. BJC16-A38]|uniref:outer membrane protein assembly factor BamB family protein n=1 Tax=Mucilaginibacter phenanthrenivorans TaxID=1234842 RepID=UPI0021588FBD|nr:PQQ-binding-like beta-propeller repeat protein [Mucilaginibacter phenanthrenivorans]MCR8561365.1 PQQ-binding-like beta-propeller repeat protein [Mucilaginibacter phenanthrenivorans]